MSRESAMTEFVKVLNSVCPLFKPYIQAHKTEQEELERIRKEEEERIRREQEEEKQRSVLEEETKAREQQEKVKQSQQESQIRAALNQQTAIHFKQYAEQQFPNNTEQQDSLITQLQEQHYQQYMQQVYQQQLLHQQEQYKQLQAMQEGGDSALNTENAVKKKAPKTTDENGVNDGEEADDEEDEEELSENGMPPIAAASMWTRKDLSEFKNNLQKDKDSVIKVGSGETVTVRVPTHEDGTCLFWEFATDSYDIGFGVYFEWTVSPSNQVSVHVSESSDEEDVEDEETKKKGDLESGSNSKQDNKPPTDEIIPIYRRDCHEEVYCGSHMYPGRGVYLLKFDNSYSLWRGKTLYYRVYYTR
ncbi:unnamed protein product [Owenia fusiformis]|uniref:Uncharacterized protein n=2 Tax=Owenia fusiformis TaxID=6347 RepID=A0A8J1U2I6_OWEFU|nr:unnamed protein product [Owenia fusiformis]